MWHLVARETNCIHREIRTGWNIWMGGGEIIQLCFYSEEGSLYPVSMLSGDHNMELLSL